MVKNALQEIDNTNEYSGRGSNQSGMRAQNERLVLTILRHHAPLAKAEIARATGLSAQTVSVIMRALEEEGLLTRDAPIRGKVGQPSVPMRLAPDGAYFLGLKLGRRSAELVLTDFMGTVMSRAMQVHDYPEPGAVVEFVVAQIDALLAGLTAAQRKRVAGLGIAMPYFLWDWADRLGVPAERMAPWRHTDLRTEIASRTDLPIYMQNDISAACGAEVVFGHHASQDNYLYVYMGYFIGGGIVLDGKLFTGHGNAGALGPLRVPDGQGQMQQLIDVASLSVLEASLRAAGHPTSRMWESAEAWDIDAQILSDWVDRAAHGLAHAIVTACAVIDFGAVRIDGWLPRDLLSRVITATQDALSAQDLTGVTVPTVVPGDTGPDARVLGAASLPLSNRFLIS